MLFKGRGGRNIIIAFEAFQSFVEKEFDVGKERVSSDTEVFANDFALDIDLLIRAPCETKSTDVVELVGEKSANENESTILRRQSGSYAKAYRQRRYCPVASAGDHPLGIALGSGDICRIAGHRVECNFIFFANRATTDAADGAATHRSGLDANHQRRFPVGNSRHRAVDQRARR